MILMHLGPHAFYVPKPGTNSPGFESVQRDSNFTWISQGRLSRDPAMQFTGPGEDHIIIEGRLFPHIFGGLDTLEGLRQSGRAGKPLLLVRFYDLEDDEISADPIGKFVIKRVKRSESKIGSSHIGNQIDFVLELTEFGDDPGISERFIFSSMLT